MTDLAPLSWTPIEWSDPRGGTIRLWPFLPNVVLTDTLRRSTGKWDGLAYILPDDEPEIWDEQSIMEKSSPGINRDSITSSGGTLARMMLGMSSIESVQTCRFPDPELRRLLSIAESTSGTGKRPVFFVEPDDEEWTDWVEDCADEMVRLRHLVRSIFSRKIWKKTVRQAMRVASPPKSERDKEKADGLAQASTFAAAWWYRSESVLSDELRERRDLRLASRLRGALATLCGGQVDDEGAPVLLVPVMQAWMPSIHSALEYTPLPEHVQEEEE
ncbi:MAG: hypothetical protein VX473_06865 [Candidatus Thermoplasmatota archaeon]|nr:hypothetical protein [Candidatus Thermoplasmatota archaeon]